MPGISTTSIFTPSAISLPAANYQLISDLQLLAPHYWKQFVEKYGDQDYTQWLSTFAGMEKVDGRAFFHFEDLGKLMVAITSKNAISAPAAGATVTVTLITADHYQSGTESPIRVGETVKTASSGIEGKVLTVNKATPNAHFMTVRPLRSDQAFVSAGSANLLANEVIKLMSNSEAGESSTNIDPQMPVGERIDNTTTEIREDWDATDRAEMEAVYYDYDRAAPTPGINRDGQGAYTYRGLVAANRRFLNNVAFKLMFGGIQNNTGLNPGTVGTKGLVPEIVARGQATTYSLGSLDLGKIHAITAQMDVQGNPVQNDWLMDIFQRQEFDDTLFAQYPAGAFVWGQGSQSEEASVGYGFQNFRIDAYMLRLKKYSMFNTEVIYGKTPDVDQYRNFGIIIPNGSVNTKYNNGGETKMGKLPNATVMYQDPRGGGTISNAIKVWQYGGASPAANSATMNDTVSMITYRAIRAAGLNQFFTVSGS